MEAEDGSIKNIGGLHTLSGLIRSGLHASLETVTPLRPKRIFITAEDDATLQYP
jgi:hypothetical protein